MNQRERGMHLLFHFHSAGIQCRLTIQIMTSLCHVRAFELKSNTRKNTDEGQANRHWLKSLTCRHFIAPIVLMRSTHTTRSQRSSSVFAQEWKGTPVNGIPVIDGSFCFYFENGNEIECVRMIIAIIDLRCSPNMHTQQSLPTFDICLHFSNADKYFGLDSSSALFKWIFITQSWLRKKREPITPI